MPILCGKPPATTDCNALNTIAGFALPQSYRGWIQQDNGLYISGSDYVDFPFEKVDDGQIAFLALFGLSTTNVNFNLVHMNRELREDLDFLQDIFLIGNDPGGNFYVLINHSPEAKVYYWDRTHLHMTDSDCIADIEEKDESGNLYLFSDSFELFLNTFITTQRR